MRANPRVLLVLVRAGGKPLADPPNGATEFPTDFDVR